MKDTIIIGNGPAGITAAIYLKRLGFDIMIISLNSSALNNAKTIENFYGVGQVNGNDLYQKGLKQASDLGIEILEDEVLNIESNYQEHPVYQVITKNETFKTKSIVLATGIKRKMPDIKNIKDFENKNISFCAICDGFLYRGRDVYILGYTEYALLEAKVLLNVAKSVTILTNGNIETFEENKNIKIDRRIITSFNGSDFLSSISFQDETINVDGLFIAWSTPGATEFGKKLGLNLDDNKIVVDETMETNMPYFYACGDITGEPYQVAKAVYEGMIAATSLFKKLKQRNS